MIQNIDDRAGLMVEPCGLPPGAALAVAMARTVEEQRPAESGPPVPQRRPPGPCRAAGSVQEHRRHRPLPVVDDMERAGPGRHEPAFGREGAGDGA